MKSQKLKKAAAFILSLAMALSLLGTVAFAQGSITPGTYIVPIKSLTSKAPLEAVQQAFAKAFGDSVTITVSDDGTMVMEATNNHMTIENLFGNNYEANVAWIQGAEVVTERESVYTNIHGNITDTSSHTMETITVPNVFRYPLSLDENDSQTLTISVDFMAGMNGKAIDEYSTDITLTLDMENAALDDTFLFGTAPTELKPGTYSLPLEMKNANNIANNSMAAGCIVKAELMVCEDGTATVTVDLQPVTFAGFTIAAADWKIYQNGKGSDLVSAAFKTNDNGEIDGIKFTLPDKATDGTYVNMFISDPMNIAQDAYFAMDFVNTEKISDVTAPTSDPSYPVEVKLPTPVLGWNGERFTIDFMFDGFENGSYAIDIIAKGKSDTVAAEGMEVEVTDEYKGIALAPSDTNTLYTAKAVVGSSKSGETEPVSVYSLVSSAFESFAADIITADQVAAVNDVITKGGLYIVDGQLTDETAKFFDLDETANTLSLKKKLTDSGVSIKSIICIMDGQTTTLTPDENGVIHLSAADSDTDPVSLEAVEPDFENTKVTESAGNEANTGLVNEQ